MFLRVDVIDDESRSLDLLNRTVAVELVAKPLSKTHHFYPVDLLTSVLMTTRSALEHDTLSVFYVMLVYLVIQRIQNFFNFLNNRVVESPELEFPVFDSVKSDRGGVGLLEGLHQPAQLQSLQRHPYSLLVDL